MRRRILEKDTSNVCMLSLRLVCYGRIWVNGDEEDRTERSQGH